MQIANQTINFDHQLLQLDSIILSFNYTSTMSRKQKQCGLGKALQNRLEKKRFVGSGDKAPIFYQETEENEAQIKKMKMKSVIEQNSLTQFLQVAQMSQQDFHANRNIKFKDIREQLTSKRILPNHSDLPRFIQNKVDGNLLVGIQMPRRPQWKQAKNKTQLQQLENDAYLTWRRKLAHIEQTNEGISITPYQKNLEVWKQLWRVVDRVNVLVQIVDGRNPLFFYSQDLVAYAKEHGKNRFLVVVNKSDLIEEKIRTQWNNYFIDQKIDHVFFTAKDNKLGDSEEQVSVNSPQVLSPHQLITIFQKYAEGLPEVEIGLTGYPNVGKSSVINTVLGKKKVGVASMPGKTKHFQTLKLTDTVTLCDCPGLVFPKISQSKAEMVLNGLYAIDTIKQFEEPLQLIAYRVNKTILEQLYAIEWKEDQPYDGESILVKYAKLKGFSTGSGLPNQAQAARHILKDYVNGVLVYNHPPPHSQQEMLSFEQRQAQIEQEKLNFEKKEEKVEQNLDEDFFQKNEVEVKTFQEIINGLEEDDLLDIIEGKRVEGLKVTKQMRKQIKFALKRGAKVDEIRKQLLTQGSPDHKILIRV